MRLLKTTASWKFTMQITVLSQKQCGKEFSFEQKLRNSGMLAGLKRLILLRCKSNYLDWRYSWGEHRRYRCNRSRQAIQNSAWLLTALAMQTLAEGTTVPVQLLKGINGVQALYEDDLKGDLEDKIALQVSAMIATANNPIVTTAKTTGANISDVIEVTTWQLRQYTG